MAWLDYRGHPVYYEFAGEQGPILVFANGLTQGTHHWYSTCWARAPNY